MLLPFCTESPTPLASVFHTVSPTTFFPTLSVVFAQDLQECLANMDDERQYAALGAKVMLSNAHCHGQQRSTGTKAMYANSTQAPAAYPFVWAICACDQVRARLDRYPQFPAVFAIFPQIFSHFFGMPLVSIPSSGGV